VADYDCAGAGPSHALPAAVHRVRVCVRCVLCVVCCVLCAVCVHRASALPFSSAVCAQINALQGKEDEGAGSQEEAEGELQELTERVVVPIKHTLLPPLLPCAGGCRGNLALLMFDGDSTG
jgi:hypothetical protein